jgi:GTP-binding protein Era
MSDNPNTKCGFVALVGAPNAGKSTLLNTLVGSKIAIVTHKVQTTRSKLVGVAIHDENQMIFVDTPGIFTATKRLERAMVSAAWEGANDADVVVFMVDATLRIGDSTRTIAEGLRNSSKKAILVLNKIDLVRRDTLLAKTQELNELGEFEETLMISATTGNGLDVLREKIAEYLPLSPWLYPEDHLTDISERMLAAEITREKIFLMLRQELPYATTVETEKWEEKKDGSVKIDQTIYVERPTQKAIVLGKNGTQIKSIGESARRELEKLLNVRIHLFLFVKVREKWGDDPERYRDWGLDYNA